jgi:hypothetical protein
MDSGQTRSFTYSAKPGVNEGEHVKLVDGGKRLALLAGWLAFAWGAWRA